MTTTTTKLKSAQNTKGKLSFPNRSHEVAYLKKSLGKKLFALALKTPSSTSKKDVTTAVKACKGRKEISIEDAVNGIMRVTYLRHCAKLERYDRRYNRSKYYIARGSFFTQKCRLNHAGSLSERLWRYKTTEIRRCVSYLMVGLSGVVSEKIEFAADFAGVAFRCETSKGEQYGGRCTYHKTDGAWTATVQSNWNSHVAKRNLARVDGMPTLAALPVESDIDGEEIFRAKWLEKSRGFSACVRSGYIVRRIIDGRTYTAHAGSISAARSVITRQTPASLRAADERAKAKAQQIERLQAKIAAKLEAGQLNGYAPVVVTMRDSFAVGNCGSGTRNWIAKHLAGRTSATVAEIIKIRDEHPRVLLACLHAIMRSQPEALVA